MTKLDEAVEAALSELGREALLSFPLKTNPDNMKAAGQAFVKAIMPPPIKNGEVTEKGLSIFAAGYEDGHNACRAEILKNAGIE